MSNDKLFLGGLPYAPDVEKLKEKYPHPEENTIIPSEELAVVVQATQKSTRFYGIVNSWRKHLLRDRGIDSQWLPGFGVKILEPAERLEASEKDFRKGCRVIHRSRIRMSMTPRDRLDSVGQMRFDHQIRLIRFTEQAALDCRKLLSVDIGPVRSLPKPALVSQNENG